MAKPVYTLFDGFTGGGEISNAFLVNGNAKGFYGVDTQNDNEFRAKGRGLDYDLGRPTDGVINSLDVTNEEGVRVFSLTKLNIDVGLIGGATIAQFFTNIMTNISVRGYTYVGTSGDDNNLYTSVGNDVVKGRAGNDSIGGGKGNDTLWGGDGDDTFGFFTGYGKDRIMDFDADGSDGHQDLLSAIVPDPAAITQIGKNTVIDYGNGDILTLVGIKAADIDTTDFV